MLDPQDPSSAVTVCATPSRLVHVAVLPSATVSGFGLKAKFWIVALICIATRVGVAVDSGSGVAVADGVGVCVGIVAVGVCVGVVAVGVAVGWGTGVFAVGVAVGWGTGVFAGGSGEGVAMATGVAVGSGAGVSVGVEVTVGRVWTPGWLVAHLIGLSRRSTAELRVCGPCMTWSVPPT